MGKNSSAVSDRSSEVLVPFLCLDKPLVERSPHPECQLCAIVPVRNEAELLPQTLSSLLNQVDLTGQPLSVDKRSHQGDSAERYVPEQNTDAIRHASRTRSPEAIWGKGA